MRFAPLAVLGLLLIAPGCDTVEDGPPRSAEILRIVVDDAPLSDVAGQGWDGDNPLSDGPEIYFRLFDDFVDYVSRPGDDRLNPRDDGDIVSAPSSSSAWYENVEVADFPLIWEVDPGYIVRDLDDPLYVALFDYDPTTGDDPMAESEVFTLRDIAPAIVDDQADVVRLDGFDLDGDAIADFDVRVTVRFLD
ncbi:hypothetical protein [Rubrivirga marina]|uniref:Uncharacterized protein n=1 Tax=Rubrivirga marina TaxID=1196024 RepID=A0A271J2V0_9BACT|nr:hypothetical protein [Rubrivirga marina]PAP77773.1 hypothetical protein BSZ37_15630 [Rubrivirga marina]